MQELLITPQENFRWTEALRVRKSGEHIEPIHTFPLRHHKGMTSYFTDNIESKLLNGRKRVTKPTLMAVTCLAVNLARAATEAIHTGFLFSLNKRNKSIPKRFRRSSFGVKTMGKVILRAEELGLVKLERGFKNEGYVSGLPSLIIPTGPCIQLIESNKQYEVIDISKPSDPIVLRYSPMDYVDYTDSSHTVRLRECIQAQNEARVSSLWEYLNQDGAKFQLHTCDLECRRIFKGDWHAGGRFYCDAQNLPKEHRGTITINGERSIELDYKSMHPRMLYHLAGYDAPYDCYEIDGVSRDAIKKLALISTSTTSRDKAVQAASFHLKVKRSEANELLCAFENKNRPIANMLYKGHWATLQNKDSHIANNVMNSLTFKGIPVLPVHDSFIVPEAHKETLKEVMQTEYEKLMGKQPDIDC